MAGQHGPRPHPTADLHHEMVARGGFMVEYLPGATA